MRIFVAVVGLAPEHKTRLETALAGHELVYRDTLPDDAAKQAGVAAAEIVFGNVPAPWLVAAPKLRWVQLDSAGVDAFLKCNATRAANPIVFTNLRDFYGQAVAEATLGGILAFYRCIPQFAVAQRDRRWIKQNLEASIGQLHGARVLILGAGAIGRATAALLRPYQGEILFYARTAPEAKLRSLAELDAALPSADVVINTLPQTPATDGLLDRGRLGRFKPTALLVNMGRGSAVDEVALLEALTAGRLRGAVLDVTRTEPLPADNPLWDHPQVLLTQHTAGRFPGETSAKIDRFLENYARFARGEALPGAIDTSRGY